MEILLFTIFASVLLAAGFITFFVYTQKNPDADCDRDSLLPLEDDQPVASTTDTTTSTLKEPRKDAL